MGGMKNARTKYEKKIAKSARSESGGNSQSENLFKIHRASYIATKDCHTHTHTPKLTIFQCKKDKTMMKIENGLDVFIGWILMFGRHFCSAHGAHRYF